MTSSGYSSPLQPREKEKARFMYKQNDDAERLKQRIGLPEVYALLAVTERNDEKRFITAKDFIDDQVNDPNCRQASSTVGSPGSTYKQDRSEFQRQLVTIYWAVQKVVPTSPPARLLYQSKFSKLAEESGGRGIHDMMRRQYCWPHNANYVYSTLKRRCRCVRNKKSGKR